MNTLELQRSLYRLGYDGGGCDGIDGPKTRAALEAFITANPGPSETPIDIYAEISEALKSVPTFIEAKNYSHTNRVELGVIVIHTAETPETHKEAVNVANFFAGIGCTGAPQASAHSHRRRLRSDSVRPRMRHGVARRIGERSLDRNRARRLRVANAGAMGRRLFESGARQFREARRAPLRTLRHSDRSHHAGRSRRWRQRTLRTLRRQRRVFEAGHGASRSWRFVSRGMRTLAMIRAAS